MQIILDSQHPLTQPQLDIGFISLISKLTLDIGVAGFLFNSHIPPTTLTLDIVMAGFILFVRLTTIWGGTPQALVLRLAWTWLDGAACIRQLQYTRILATTLPRQPPSPLPCYSTF